MKKDTIYRKDYLAPDYIVNQVFLCFKLQAESTLVESKLQLAKKHADAGPLILNGEALELLSIKVNGECISQYELTDTLLILNHLPDQFELEIVTKINPFANQALEGLYISKDVFCTQCEAEGFRRITYYLDRPDVLSGFTVRIEADKTRYPKLLSNGNLIESGGLADGKHFAVWHDPHKKPCYLFALVAGDLDVLADHFKTCSGKLVDLYIYVEKGKVEKAHHAMNALKKSMAWDEENYGREYDLDIFNIVAVSDFVMGAMENKSLNVFNDKYILANPETATDFDYENIDRVVGHEYFHNWTGNRVTCRSWFELCLKEGLTVFREQSFMETVRNAAVSRTEDVMNLKTRQYPEDAGPLSHPIRPESYQEINNFYTMTVYEKGSEIFRMLANLVGRNGFRKAMDCYFERFDGQAATVDDVVDVVQETNQMDLSQFRLWVSQSGTPEVHATGKYDADKKIYTLTMTQICKPTADQAQKQALLIPVALGLIDKKGNVLLENKVLSLSEPQQTFVFEAICEHPIPSLFRHFSSPVKYQYDYTNEELATLALHDTDDFNRWQSVQRYAIRVMTSRIKNDNDSSADGLLALVHQLLNQTILKPRLLAKCLELPSELELFDYFDLIDSDQLSDARNTLLKQMADKNYDQFLKIYQTYHNKVPYQYEKTAVEARALKNICLFYLAASQKPEALSFVKLAFDQADNMTDSFAALTALNQVDCQERQDALQAFYDQWAHEHLVVNKWLSLQASTPFSSALSTVQSLMTHPAFDLKNPNKVYALVLQFASHNFKNFHQATGEGYQFLAENVIEIDAFNPQVAGRLVKAFSSWRQFTEDRQAFMKKMLENIANKPGLSSDVAELTSKMLG